MSQIGTPIGLIVRTPPQGSNRILFWNGTTWVTLDINSVPGLAEYIASQVAIVSGVGDLHYYHPQPVASAIWTINHNLGKHPSVNCFEDFGSGGVQEVDGHVTHIDSNTLVVNFLSSISGFAHLN